MRYTAPSLMILSLALCGCGDGVERPTVYPVSGSVMYNGKPVAGASVAFWAEGAARSSAGITDSEGKFQLSMFEPNDGALPGPNTITVSKIDAAATSTGSDEAMLNDPAALAGSMAEAAAAKPKHLIPERYSSRTSTTLKETVSESGENSFVLQLTD